MSKEDGGAILHKHTQRRAFVQIENSTVRDPRLSLKATGLLAHLLSLPQRSPISSVAIARTRPDGRVAIQAAYKELREYGYVRQERTQIEGGRWTTVTHVYEVPPNAENLPSDRTQVSRGSVDLPLSLREKDGTTEEEDLVVGCSRCGLMCTDVDAVADHIEAGECPADDPGWAPPSPDLKVVS